MTPKNDVFSACKTINWNICFYSVIVIKTKHEKSHICNIYVYIPFSCATHVHCMNKYILSHFGCHYWRPHFLICRLFSDSTLKRCLLLVISALQTRRFRVLREMIDITVFRNKVIVHFNGLSFYIRSFPDCIFNKSRNLHPEYRSWKFSLQ